MREATLGLLVSWGVMTEQQHVRTAYVLVVEDNPASLAACQKVIELVPGCIAKCFAKPVDALAWAKDTLPALVLVDYAMPDMDGLAFIRAFRTIPKRNAVPVVMLTGAREPAVEREALQLGVIDFLQKPANVKRLTAHVSKVLAHV